MTLLRAQTAAEVLRDASIPVGVEQAREQLLGRLAGIKLDRIHLLAGQHQARLEFEQGGDEDEELSREVEVELASALEMIDIGDDDVGEVDLEQIDLLAQDERQQQIERTREDVKV